ncbi:MAG TPA: hypothetical protein VLB80_04950 [Candidatus Babeliales bacterium]|nr:hypothetical protein [Candidatus Babeliales bacterium]
MNKIMIVSALILFSQVSSTLFSMEKKKKTSKTTIVIPTAHNLYTTSDNINTGQEGQLVPEVECWSEEAKNNRKIYDVEISPLHTKINTLIEKYHQCIKECKGNINDNETRGAATLKYRREKYVEMMENNTGTDKEKNKYKNETQTLEKDINQSTQKNQNAIGNLKNGIEKYNDITIILYNMMSQIPYIDNIDTLLFKVMTSKINEIDNDIVTKIKNNITPEISKKNRNLDLSQRNDKKIFNDKANNFLKSIFSENIDNYRNNKNMDNDKNKKRKHSCSNDKNNSPLKKRKLMICKKI